jgi:hypothetical protein
VLGRSPGEGAHRAQEQVRGVLAGRYLQNVSARTTSMAGAPGIQVEIVVRVPVVGWGGPGLVLTVQGSAVREVAQ